MAAVVKRARVSCLVTGVTYRNPAVLAKMAVTVDHISGGRLDFGLGAGWHEAEHRGYGIEFPSAGTRVAMLDEALTIIRRLWTEESVTVEGRFYTVRDALCEPKPLQRPHPPIVIGGEKPKMLAGRRAPRRRVECAQPRRRGRVGANQRRPRPGVRGDRPRSVRDPALSAAVHPTRRCGASGRSAVDASRARRCRLPTCSAVVLPTADSAAARAVRGAGESSRWVTRRTVSRTLDIAAVVES